MNAIIGALLIVLFCLAIISQGGGWMTDFRLTSIVVLSWLEVALVIGMVAVFTLIFLVNVTNWLTRRMKRDN